MIEVADSGWLLQCKVCLQGQEALDVSDAPRQRDEDLLGRMAMSV